MYVVIILIWYFNNYYHCIDISLKYRYSNNVIFRKYYILISNPGMNLTLKVTLGLQTLKTSKTGQNI